MSLQPPTQPDEIARALSATFPELGQVAVQGVLGSGFNSIAVETGGGLVFRIAKTEGTAQRFARERRLMPVLRAHLPVAVPDPRWLVERSEAFPFGVAGYPKLAGRILTRVRHRYPLQAGLCRFRGCSLQHKSSRV